jgi:hypothetical protein
VADLCGGPGLLDHAGPHLAGRQLRLEHLDGDVDAELFVAGAVDIGHPAAAEVRLDGVAPADGGADEVVLRRLVLLRVEVVDVDEPKLGAGNLTSWTFSWTRAPSRGGTIGASWRHCLAAAQSRTDQDSNIAETTRVTARAD